jgi:drug/metabolite transporter (DMT)-like permease
MYPVIVAMSMMIFYGEDRAIANIIAIVISILGVYLMANGDGVIIDGGNTILGLVCSIISAFSFAAYYIVMKKTRADKIESVKFTTWMMVLCAVYFIVAAVSIDGKITIATDLKSWLNILGLGLWATMISNFTGVKAIRRIGPTLTSILGALQPLTAVILGVIFLDEHLGPRTIIGITLILIAVFIIIMHQKKISRKVH